MLDAIPFPLLIATSDERAQDIVLLVVYVLIALGVSSLCSVFEAVLLSVTPAYVAMLEKKEGDSSGPRIRRLKEDIDRPLAAILSLNTIAHTIGAAGAGAQATKVWGSGSLGIVSAILTLLILILSEILPKSLGASYWRQLAPWVARGLVVLVVIVYPLVWMARWLTRLVASGHGPGQVSREEISAMAMEGADKGVLEASESRILKSLFRFDKLRAQDIMTPRTVLFSLDQGKRVQEIAEAEPKIRFSRIPIYGESPDDITGYVLLPDVLLAAARDQLDRTLGEFTRELTVVPAALPLSLLFDKLLRDQAHVALVVDEYGGTAGLVTMEDVVETLLGMEIVDEVDAVTDMQDLARRQWEERARRLGLVSDEEPSAGEEAAPTPDEPPGSG